MYARFDTSDITGILNKYRTFESLHNMTKLDLHFIEFALVLRYARDEAGGCRLGHVHITALYQTTTGLN